MEKSVMVLGRGMSLKKLADFDHSKFDTIILANSFYSKNLTNSFQQEKKYCDDPLIHSVIKDKKIYMVCSPYQNFFDSDVNNFLEKYNVIKCYKCLFSSGRRIGKDGPIFKILPDSVLNDFVNFKKGETCTGTIAMMFAIKELKYKNIYIFGKDFYEKEYYISNNIKTANPENYKKHFSSAHVAICKKKFTKFINFYPHINFFLYTLANYKPNIENIKVL